MDGASGRAARARGLPRCLGSGGGGDSGWSGARRARRLAVAIVRVLIHEQPAFRISGKPVAPPGSRDRLVVRTSFFPAVVGLAVVGLGIVTGPVSAKTAHARCLRAGGGSERAFKGAVATLDFGNSAPVRPARRRLGCQPRPIAT
jgi:hypothetical protein